MYTLAIITLAAVVLGSEAVARSGESKNPIDNGWDRKLLDYVRPAKLVVEETTPTDAQVNFWMRPPQTDAEAPEPRQTGRAEPRAVGNINIVHLRFKDATGDIVPALLCTPKGKPGPFPVVVAVHGLTSNKAQVCAQVAPELTKRGYAVLAADMPCHGERPGTPFTLVDSAHPQRSYPLYREAIIDVRQLIDVAETRPELDTKGDVVLAGYSMGSWISSVAGPCDDRVRAMVLMVGGAHDTPASVLKNPMAAAVDPRISIAHFAGRPLLLLNGKTDTIVKPELSRRLFAACPEPKTQTWYDSGHLLPDQAYADAAKWIDEQFHAAAASDDAGAKKRAG